MLGNLRLKLLAIFFAVSLWSVVAYASNPTQNHSYRMAIANVASLPAGLVLVGPAPTVPLTVTGTADNLRNFDAHDLTVTGNFNNVKVGTNQVPIHVTNGDPDVLVDAPGSVPVRIDQLGTVNLSVSIDRINALVSGYHEESTQTSVSPATVRIDGPKSQLNGIQAVAIVDLNGVSAPGFTKPFPVTVRDAAKKNVTTNFTVTPPQVAVKMVITADAITVPKAVGWTLTGQPAAGFRVTNVTVAPLQVNATGIQNALGNIGFLSTDPVDISNAKGDVVKLVTIRPPDGVVVSQRTATVHVFIGPAPGVSPTATASP